MEKPEFWISGNVPSSKNNKVWTGKYLVHSAATKKWLKTSTPDWLAQRHEFLKALKGLPLPYYIEFTFVRGARHRFDYINAAQIVFDTMQECGWIPNDDGDTVKPYFEDYIYNKANPGVMIRILRTKPDHKW